MGRRFESCRKRWKLFPILLSLHLKFFEKNIKNSLSKEEILFYIGLFLLPSAFSVAAIVLLLSLIISFKKNKINIKDKYNIFFLISCLLLFTSSLINFLNVSSINNISNNSSLTFIGLLNWIPQIIAFVGFQKYLTKNINRERAIIVLTAGSIPVIFSCIIQGFFNWHGPIRTLFGLIVWYQRPIDGLTDMTGLFSNPNYLAAWLNIIWPFSVGLLFFNNKSPLKVIIKFILSATIAFFIVLTSSKAAWICLFLPIPVLYGTKFIKWIISSSAILAFTLVNLSFPLFGNGFQSFLRQIVPKGIWINLTKEGYESLDISRVDIWGYACKFILENPIFGYGSRAFPTLFSNETGIWKGHSHNLPLELMISYGIPATFMILIPIIVLIFKCYYKLFFNKLRFNKITIIDRVWIISLTSLVLMHLVDIQYFDGRVSIIGWILLAGSRNILFDNIHNEVEKKIS